MTFTGRRKTTTYRIITPGTRSFRTGGYNSEYEGDGLSVWHPLCKSRNAVKLHRNSGAE